MLEVIQTSDYDASKNLSGLLQEAQEASSGMFVEVVSKGDKARLLWLENQLAHITSQLQAMLADLEAGVTIRDLGFSGNDEFQEMVDDLHVEIANLKGLIRACKEIGR